MKNILLRLKPKGTPPVLTPSIKAFRLLLALNPCGCGRFPPASNVASKKQKKVDNYFFTVNSRDEMLYFFLFFACHVWAGGNRP